MKNKQPAVIALILNFIVICALIYAICYTVAYYGIINNHLELLPESERSGAGAAYLFVYIFLIIFAIGGNGIFGLVLLIFSLDILIKILNGKEISFAHYIVGAVISVIPAYTAFMLYGTTELCTYNWVFILIGVLILSEIAANIAAAVYTYRRKKLKSR